MSMARYRQKKLWIMFGILMIVAGCSSDSGDPSKDSGAVRKKISMEPQQAPSVSPPMAATAPVETPPQAPVQAGADIKELQEPPNATAGQTQPEPQASSAVDVQAPAASSTEVPALGMEKAKTDADGRPMGEIVSSAVSYMIDNKIDPYIPLFKDELQEGTGKPDGGADAHRTPQSPLETMDLDQLKLTGIVRTQLVKKALIEEASGKGYVIEVGTYIGQNGGRVTQIFDDRVIVQEETANVLGKKTVRERELKLLHGEGEKPHE